MARQKKPKSVYSFLIPKLRYWSRQWKPISECRTKAKVKVEDGTFKNGNIKYTTKYKCQKCGAIVDKVEIDHITPIGAFTNYSSWDGYINAIYCQIDNLMALCRDCHQIKTDEENEKRVENRKNKS